MLGTFQKSQLRIEIEASATAIGSSLLKTEQLKSWLPSNRLSSGMPEQLTTGFEFTNMIWACSDSPSCRCNRC